MTLVTGISKYLREKLRTPRRIAIVGSRQEVSRIMELLNRIEAQRTIAGWIATNNGDTAPALIGHISQLQDIVRQQAIGELIFSARDVTFSEINTWMSKLGPTIAYRISSSESGQIVGSDSRKAQGTLYTADVEFALAYPSHRRAKRIFDCVVSVFLLGVWPFTAMLRKDSTRKLQNILTVIQGKKTWIGYHSADKGLSELPALRQGVISIDASRSFLRDSSEIHMINYIYAREYTVWRDVDLFLRNISQFI